MDTAPETRMQKALRWVASEMALRPEMKRWQLLQEAAQEFDLDPRESELLLQLKPGNSEAE